MDQSAFRHKSEDFVTFAVNVSVKREGVDLHNVKVEPRDGNVSSRHRRSTITMMRTLLGPLNAHQLMEYAEISFGMRRLGQSG